MISEELNRRIEQLCDEANFFEAFGGKCIPYIGWFWREVDFDRETCRFGVIPNHGNHLIGFMQSNKWGYLTVEADKDEWAEIKRLLIEAVIDSTAENLEAVNYAVQALSQKLSSAQKTLWQRRD